MSTISGSAQEKGHLPSSNHGQIVPYHKKKGKSDFPKVEPINTWDTTVPLLCSYRLGVIMCCMLSMIISFGTQATMSSAMVCMLKESKDADYAEGPFSPNWTTLNETFHFINLTDANSTKGDDSDWRFDWSKSTQGWVLSSFFMGYYVSQIPSTFAVAAFGAKKVVSTSLILVSVFQLLAVPAAHLGVGWLIADRIIVGLINGFLYAPIFALVGGWTPRRETSLLFGIVGMGMELGNVFSYVCSLVACKIPVQSGWPFVFYFMASLGLIIAFLNIIFVSDSPFNNRLISQREVKYISASVPKLDKKAVEALIQIPIKDILLSMKVWAITVSQLGSDWLYYFLVVIGPTFLKDVIKLSETEINLLSGLPFLAVIPTVYLAGYISDKLVTKGNLSNTKVRKFNDFICKIIPAGILLGLGFLPEHSIISGFVLYTVGAMTIAFSYVSWMANPVDLAPAYTAFIVGVCEMGAIWVSIAIPILSENLTTGNTREEWLLFFYITAALQVFTFMFYAIFGSGELQPWAVSSYQHSYEDIDGNYFSPDLKKKLLSSDTNRSLSSSFSSLGDAKKKNAQETQELLRSLSLSLGDFRGTSSYEEGLRAGLEKRRRDKALENSTGAKKTKSQPVISADYQFHDYEDMERGGAGEISYWEADPRKVRKNSYLEPGAAKNDKTDLDSTENGFANLGFQGGVPKSMNKSQKRNPPEYGQGDHNLTLHPSQSSTQYAGDRASPTQQARNVKSIALELAEALSRESLLEKDEPNKSLEDYISNESERAGRRDSISDGARNHEKKVGNGMHAGLSGSDVTDAGLRPAQMKNISKPKRGHLEAHEDGQPPTLDVNAHMTKEANMNHDNGSSIMVPSEDEPDLRVQELDPSNRAHDSATPGLANSQNKSRKKPDQKDKKPGFVKRLFNINKERDDVDSATT